MIRGTPEDEWAEISEEVKEVTDGYQLNMRIGFNSAVKPGDNPGTFNHYLGCLVEASEPSQGAMCIHIVYGKAESEEQSGDSSGDSSGGSSGDGSGGSSGDGASSGP